MSQLSITELLEQVATRFNEEAQQYNEVIDLLEAKEAELVMLKLQMATVSELQQRIAGLETQLAEEQGRAVELEQRLTRLTAQNEALVDGNKYALQQVKEIKAECKRLKAHGDPDKIVAQNRTLRERATTAEREYKDLEKWLTKHVTKGGDFFDMPMFETEQGQAVYAPRNKIRLEHEGKTIKVIPLVFATPEGFSRLITWDGSRVHFASFGHAELDAKYAPSQPVVDFAIGWFTTSVVVKPDHNQEIKPKNMRLVGC